MYGYGGFKFKHLAYILNTKKFLWCLGRGWRFYNGKVVYPFAHGLSYTTFAAKFVRPPPKYLKHSELSTVFQSNPHPSQSIGLFEVTVNVTNTGNLAGKQILMLTMTPPNPGYFGNPLRELVAFKKVATIATIGCTRKNHLTFFF